MKRIKKPFLIAAIIIAGIGVFQFRVSIKDYLLAQQKPELPREALFKPAAPSEPGEVEDISGNRVAEAGATLADKVVSAPVRPDDRKSEVNLAVPFQAQAPLADWSMPYKEGCEEASIIMVSRYYRGTALSKEMMKAAIDQQVAWQEKEWGGHYDLPLRKVALMAEYYYDYQTEIISDITIEKIKDQLFKGRPVIVPSAGRELGNPNFRTPGPLYHMLVIKGYTNDGLIITNDPGTRNGSDYLYQPEVLMAAIADWDGDSPDGEKVGLVIYP